MAIIFFVYFFGHVWVDLGKNPSHPKNLLLQLCLISDVTNGRAGRELPPGYLTLKTESPPLLYFGIYYYLGFQ